MQTTELLGTVSVGGPTLGSTGGSFPPTLVAADVRDPRRITRVCVLLVLPSDLLYY